ncbi:MAG: hypothetical protein ACR2MS_11360 [Weeksellaceae bacterium]
MKRILLTFTCIFMLCLAQGQVGISSQSNHGKVRVGGGLGVNFGSNSYFGFNLSPFIGYAITPRLEGGVTAGYQYGKDDYQKSNLFSVGPYMNYGVMESIFLRSHLEYYTGNQTLKRNDYERSFDETALWLGAGYQSTGRIRFQTGIMYNVLYDEDDSIFASAIRPYGGVVVSL